MDTTVKILKYWRNSLADAHRMDIKSEVANEGYEANVEFKAGGLPGDLVQTLFKEWIKTLNNLKTNKGDDEEDPDPLFVPLLIAPLRIIRRVEHNEGKFGEDPESIFPLWVPASVGKDGQLSPHEHSFPWIPRMLLEPVQESFKYEYLTLGTVRAQDTFLTKNEVPASDWCSYAEYCDRLFQSVTGQKLGVFQEEGYETDVSLKILIQADKNDPAWSVRGLYDQIVALNQVPALLRNFANLDFNPPEDLITDSEYTTFSARHVGQMGNRFPLSNSQRQAMFHFLNMRDGEIYVVNGPPGTGKTTLLQSVVAQLVVERAVEGKDPPVIVACSATNQAVSNIIDSFSKGQDNESLLAERWLPEIKYLGLYLPSSRISPTGDLHYARNNRDGLPNMTQNSTYFSKANPHFLKKCLEFSGKTFQSAKEAAAYLHGELVQVVDEIAKGSRLWKDLEESRQVLREVADGIDLAGYLQKIDDELRILDEKKKLCDRIRGQLIDIKTGEPLLQKFFSFIGIESALGRRGTKIREVLNAWPFPVNSLDFRNWGSVMGFIERDLTGIMRRSFELNAFRKKATDCKANCTNAGYLLEQWKAKHAITGDFFEAIRYMDTTLRYRAFNLAIHYWEARWLDEIEPILQQGGEFIKRGQKKMEAMWRRYAKLTPCFVATFFMLPSYFTYSRRNDENTGFFNLPSLNFIDLLIVDEAGQVGPDLGGAAFALAKRAIVVGDRKQIPPIQKVTSKVDSGNLFETGVISGYESEDEIDRIVNRGLSAYKGSLLHVAQGRNRYQLEGMTEGGLFLQEHRRCFPEIIQYCNELAYRGRLIPLREAPQKGETLFPQMGYANIPGGSKKIGGSRINPLEAAFIAQWLSGHKDEIERHYGKELKQCVGIITPFKKQKQEIRGALRREGIDHSGMTVGTIHALQGAEREIVIFSPVYGSEDGSSLYFLNKEIYMLNVAVSRAKDSFLVFGDMRIFNPEEHTPTGILARHLFRIQENELPGIVPPRPYSDDCVEHINTLDRHREMLSQAFAQAGKTLLIVSPYLSINAVKADNVPQMLSAAIARGVGVTIYSDRNLNRKNGHPGEALKPNALEAQETIRQAGATLVMARGVHNKTLCIDDCCLVEGSFNWLSAHRDPLSPLCRYEASLVYRGDNVASHIREITSRMRKIAKG